MERKVSRFSLALVHFNRVTILAAGVAAVLLWGKPANATPITYNYVQTGASVPGLQIGVSLTVDATFADLPTISCPGLTCSSPLNFGNLLAFTFISPGGQPVFTLSNFTIPGQVLPTFPMWNISPTRITFVDSTDNTDFDINLITGAIFYNTDASSNPTACRTSGACMTSGAFSATPVPEPSTLVLVGIGAVGLIARRKQKHSVVG